MSILKLVEDRPTPKAVYNWRVYLLAAVASCTSCMIGYDSAFIGTTLALDSFKSEFHFNTMSTATKNLISANIVSCYQAGAFFGAFFAYPIGHFWGRRIGLLAAGLVFILGAGLMLGANGDRGLGLIYAGRVLAGLGVGAGSNITPIYISELSPPAIRGRLVGVYELGWQIGGLVGFWINVSVLTKPKKKKKNIFLCANLFVLVWCLRDFGSQPQAMVDSLRRSADPCRSPVDRWFLHSRVAPLVVLPRPS
jgi:MFS family permease